ncbi:MAG: A24 family peptidase [Alphaproteobacteria bacterium]|nr:A24 family peptidase [Alphaproteobacteria bacterium]
MFESLFLSRTKAITALALGLAAAAVGWMLGPVEFRAASILLAFALAWASVVDFDRFILPDALTLGLVVAGLALASTLGSLTLLHHVIGAVAGYAVLALVAFAYRRWRGREGLGRGDAKLLAAAGAWLGWAALPQILLMASVGAMGWVLAGVLARRRFNGSDPIAFGPFIALGFWLAWTFGAGTSLPYDTMSSR